MNIYPPGIPDDQFIRGSVPIVEYEVRAVVMAMARLQPGLRVLDLGAGTGTFTVEAALFCPHGQITAVECDPEALDLLRRNIARFELANVTVLEGEAPEVLAGLAPFDRILLGGFGTRLREILEALPACLTPGGRVVSSTIGLESTTLIVDRFRLAPWMAREVVQVNVARGKPDWPDELRFDALPITWIAAAQLA